MTRPDSIGEWAYHKKPDMLKVCAGGQWICVFTWKVENGPCEGQFRWSLGWGPDAATARDNAVGNMANQRADDIVAELVDGVN